jgi:5-methylcytosine-specific restriction endonuclease McrBC regulatory subunit McrC
MPDLSVWRTGQDHDAAAPEAIIDAKWKNLDPARRDWGVDEKDVHQVLAYLTRYGCRTARLAYPVLSSVKGQQMPPNFRIDLPGGQTATIGVELVAIDA